MSKSYLLGHHTHARRGFVLRDVMAQSIRDLARRTRDMMAGRPLVPGDETEEFWALRDVSFQIRRGERVGVIGRNGAGKSTLLKILSSITEPTGGRAAIAGRVASLLEVGTGFHPELTGRENIFLNGAILGMTRSEIQRKFDQIVDFAEVEKFLDTPVKRYSSGMYVRLAFAVAAHLESEILLVDEVLAVGDAQFQKKCLGKMEDVGRDGRTVILVSHQMAAIQRLCGKAILLAGGRVEACGPPDEVIGRYFADAAGGEQRALTELGAHPRRRPGAAPLLRNLRILADGREATVLRMGGDLTLEVTFSSPTPVTNLRFGIALEDQAGQRLLALSPELQAPGLVGQPARAGRLACTVPGLRLLPGAYYLTLILGSGAADLDRIDQAARITVESSDVFGTGYAPGPGHGVFYQEARWTYRDGTGD